MKKQPDFAGMFRDYFGKTPAKVVYTVRQDSNRMHDITFLSSLIHDARCKRKDAVLRGKRFIIPIERECWELGTIEHPGHLDVYIARARLNVFPVKEIKWGFAHCRDFASDEELSIYDIWIARNGIHSSDYTPLIISGYDWQCVLTVCEPDLRIVLQDLETPHLYSERRTEKKGWQGERVKK